MNREIKFRVWSQSKKAFIDNGLALWRTKGKPIASVRTDNDNLVLMQYTGLKDKNGAEIYEGDIVRLRTTLINPGGVQPKGDDRYRFRVTTVSFDSGCTGFLPFSARYHYENTSECVEVIGNIYENPKLLEVSK